MKELFQLVLQFLPQYLSDLGAILARPKRFISERNPETNEAFLASLLFLGISLVIYTIMMTPLRSTGKDVWTALGSIATVAILAVFLNAILLRFVWLMVGGKASTRTFFTISGYYNGFALISLAVVQIIGVGVYKTVDAKLYESIREAASKGEPLPKVPLDDWVVGLPYLGGLLVLLVWIVIAWGAFREINRLGRFRSFIAFIISGFLDGPALAVSYFLGIAMRGS
jgi:uncharacterized membrane-anchored protein YitT (DUF2179 family)